MCLTFHTIQSVRPSKRQSQSNWHFIVLHMMQLGSNGVNEIRKIFGEERFEILSFERLSFSAEAVFLVMCDPSMNEL